MQCLKRLADCLIQSVTYVSILATICSPLLSYLPSIFKRESSGVNTNALRRQWRICWDDKLADVIVDSVPSSAVVEPGARRVGGYHNFTLFFIVGSVCVRAFQDYATGVFACQTILLFLVKNALARVEN